MSTLHNVSSILAFTSTVYVSLNKSEGRIKESDVSVQAALKCTSRIKLS